MDKDRDSPNNILTSLTLEDPIKRMNTNEIVATIPCLKCHEIFEFPSSKDDYLAHLFLMHRLVIADVEDIAILSDYLMFWIKKFKNHEFEEFCTTMLLDQLPDGKPSKNEKYYLLSDILPADYELRNSLHKTRLDNVLSQHQFELTDRSFQRECLHCRDVIRGLRSEYLEHLFNKHFVQLGKPENLVFIDELIDVVQEKLENLICLYCEKIFKDRGVLKEHMRKKGHKRINPDIKFYDKFFLINYRFEKPKKVKKINFAQNMLKSRDNHRPSDDKSNLEDKINSDEDSDWSDWDDEKQKLKCLFCSEKNVDFNSLKDHMLEKHKIDFNKVIKELNFYQKIKVVNYIRRQIHILRCVTCNHRSDNLNELLSHMENAKHFGIGEKKQWDQPEYFFPTFEDDGILCLLDDDGSDDVPDVLIYSEEINDKANINKEAENLSLENFSL